MKARDLIERLQGAPVDENRFRICARLSACFLARGPTGRPALLVPCAEGGSALGRATGAILLSYRSRVAFDVDGEAWSAPAIVLECLEENLLQTFVALALDLDERLGGEARPRAEQVLRALASWERLLRSHSSLSEERQLGLWGELEFIRSAPSIDGAIRAWNPDPEGVIDFIDNGVGVEVKTSTTRLRHAMSQRQGVATEGALRVLFASVWTVPDASGMSLGAMVAAIAESTAETVAFEQKLLAAGFSRKDADGYSRRFSRAAPILLFEGNRLPRVRSVDPGISAIRYVVDLDAMDAIESDDIIARLCLPTAS